MVLQMPLLLYVLHCAYKIQWWIMSVCDTIYLWWVMPWTETSLYPSRIYPSYPCPPWNQIHQGECALCPRVSAQWPLNHLCYGAGWRLQRQVIVHHKMEISLWWAGKSDQRQGTLKQKHCQWKPWLQRVQLLQLPKGSSGGQQRRSSEWGPGLKGDKMLVRGQG